MGGMLVTAITRFSACQQAAAIQVPRMWMCSTMHQRGTANTRVADAVRGSHGAQSRDSELQRTVQSV